MNRLRCCLLAGLLLLGAAARAAAGVGADGYQRLPLVSHADLDVALLVKPSATPADPVFIGFLLNNKTGQPLKLENASYRITLLDRGGTALAQGNDYDLLHRDRVDVNTTQPPLPPGESRHLQYCSNQALGRLGIPKADASPRRISARVDLQITRGQDHLSTPPTGVPVQFDWLPLSGAGIVQMQQRLRAVLSAGNPAGRDDHVVSTHLHHPAIGAEITTAELIEGLYAWEQAGGQILQYADAHPRHHEGLVNYALERIAKRDYLRMGVLRQATSLREARLIGPLKTWAVDGAETKGSEFALELLSRQTDLAPDPAALTAELGRAWLARSPAVRAGDLKGDPAWRWSEEMRLLALTRDRGVIPALLPFLDRKEVVVDARQIAAMNDGMSTRACDMAYNTILQILGRDGERLGVKMGGLVDRNLNRQAEYARWDVLIAQLKQELADGARER